MDEIKPYIDEDGTLVIPFECADHRYKYWKEEGAPLDELLEELDVSDEVWKKYSFNQRKKEDGEGEKS